MEQVNLKKKKSIRVIVSIVAIFSIIIILLIGYALFNVRKEPEVVFVNNNNFSQMISKPEIKKIVSDSKIKKNQLIFSINKEQVIENIESNNRLYKVLEVEKIFPGKLKLYIETRKPIFKLHDSNEHYALLDESLAVVEVIKDTDIKEKEKQFFGDEIQSFVELKGIDNSGDIFSLETRGKQLKKTNDPMRAIIALNIFKNNGWMDYLQFTTFIKEINFAKKEYLDLTTNTGVVFRINESKLSGTTQEEKEKEKYIHYETLLGHIYNKYLILKNKPINLKNIMRLEGNFGKDGVLNKEKGKEVKEIYK